MLRTVHAIRYAAPLREGGSLPGLIEADDDGMYVVKFRGAGQGAKALVAEVVTGALARAAGLPVPEAVLVDVPPELGRTEPDPEINELIGASAGLNFGLDFLPGALDFVPGQADVDARFASELVWFDALTTNVDRTARNPNLLSWHGRTWLIDHGASLYQHHAAGDLVARAGDPFPLVRDHVLLAVAGQIEAADERLAGRLGEAQVTAALQATPDVWLGHDPVAARRTYAEYLLQRLRAPRAFAEEAARAHAG